MTTILRAARELESGEQQAGLPAARARSITLVTVGLVAAAAGGALLLWTRAPHAMPPGLRVPRPSQPAPVPPRRVPVDADDRPWGQVTSPPRNELGPAPSPKLPPERANAVEVGGEPQVRLASISYADVRRRRAATLTIDGVRVTLHEGEAARGVEVQLILPDSVYLRHGSGVFAVNAAR